MSGADFSAGHLAVDQRAEQIRRLSNETFDVLIVGGGATGAGALLDAASRGLKAALVERVDFAQGTSSRSTKLVHGGVRYLEQAVKQFDRGQLELVKTALRERAIILRNAPHISRALPLITPIYSALEVPYFVIGLRLYDWLAGSQPLPRSHFFGKREALDRFPMLRASRLRGAVQYYDGQFDDARLNIELIMTAMDLGAVAINRAEVTEFEKSKGRIIGAAVKLAETGGEVSVRARTIINATGVFADKLRALDDIAADNILTASSGSHIVLPAKFSPPNTGLLIPKTEDGRVLFLLPWQGHTLVGTTDRPAPVTPDPIPSKDDIDYLLRHVNRYFNLEATNADVLAAWSGLRPLVVSKRGHDKRSTSDISRDHTIEVSSSGLITVAGGKWTTYRKMAEDAVDSAVREGQLSPQRGCVTETLPLRGAVGFDSDIEGSLVADFGLEPTSARHLRDTYGGRAFDVARIAKQGFANRISPEYPYIEAEVIHAVVCEQAHDAEDILWRRMRLGFLEANAALEARLVVQQLVAKAFRFG